MKKRLLSILLTLCMLLALVPVGASAEGDGFKDVQDSHKYYFEAVYWASSQDPQITGGYSDNTFRPNLGCSRAQVVTFLWRAAGEPEPVTEESPFTDVMNPNTYYYKAVLWAVENNITGGYKDNTFRPGQTVTRCQFVTFLWRYAGMPEPENSTSSCTDVQNPDLYYYKAVLWAAEIGVTTGYEDGTFRPGNTCTRANVVAFLYRYLYIYMSQLSTDTLSAETAVVGNYVNFGTYEQDNDLTNGAEPIEWRVLAVQDNMALLVSKYVLDVQPYNTTEAEVTWANCTLRSWLNNNFYNTAFTEDEQSVIQTALTDTLDIYWTSYYPDQESQIVVPCTNAETAGKIGEVKFHVEGCSGTMDKVTLLSNEDADVFFDWSSEKQGINFVYPDTQCLPTAYAIAHGVCVDPSCRKDGAGCCGWWLRSPGYTNSYAASVLYDGWIYGNCTTGYNLNGVRPAILVSFE